MKALSRRRLLGAMGILTAASFTASRTATTTRGSSREALPVSLVALIASPREYNGVRVHVTGYLDLAYESNAVYFHEEDYHHGLTKNAIRLILPVEQQRQFKGLSDKYVIIEGTFEADNSPDGMFSGYIVDVTRVQELLTEEEFLRRQNNSGKR